MMTYEQQQKYKRIITPLHRIGVIGPTEQIFALADEVDFYRKKVQGLEDELRKERGGAVDREARWKGAGMGDYYCSLCQHTISGRTKFCPECGAKMGEWEESAIYACVECGNTTPQNFADVRYKGVYCEKCAAKYNLAPERQPLFLTERLNINLDEEEGEG